MEASIRAIPELEELPLDEVECCDRCRRTLLVGEHVHVYAGERLVCDMCRSLEPDSAQQIRLVHGPAFGNIRIIDQRNRKARA